MYYDVVRKQTVIAREYYHRLYYIFIFIICGLILSSSCTNTILQIEHNQAGNNQIENFKNYIKTDICGSCKTNTSRSSIVVWIII